MMEETAVRVHSIVVVGWCLLFCCTTGVVYGWAAYKPVLLDAGVFSWACEGGAQTNAEGGCDQQVLYLNLAFVIGSAGMNVLTVVNGWGLDRWGRQRWVRLEAVLWLCSAVGFFTLVWVLPPYLDLAALSLCALGLLTTGGGIFISVLTVAKHGSSDGRLSSSTILAAFGVTWDISTAVFWVLHVAYFQVGLSPVWAGLGFSVVVGAALLLMSFRTIPPPEVVKGQQQAFDPKEGGYELVATAAPSARSSRQDKGPGGDDDDDDDAGAMEDAPGNASWYDDIDVEEIQWQSPSRNADATSTSGRTRPGEGSREEGEGGVGSSGGGGEGSGDGHHEGGWPWHVLLSKPLVLHAVVLSCQMLQITFFMTTVSEQALWVVEGAPSPLSAEAMANIFSLLLFLEAPLSFGLAACMRHITRWVQRSDGPMGRAVALSYVLLGTLMAAWGLASCGVWWGCLLASFVVFVPTRVFTYIAMNSFWLQGFSPNHFGRINAVLLFCAGVLSILAYPLNAWAVHGLDGSYFLPNALLVSLTYIATLAFAFGVRNEALLGWSSDS